MLGDLGTWIVFVLGIIVGGVLFSLEFRRKFFRGLRNFIAQLGQGARSVNKSYGGTREHQSPRTNFVQKQRKRFTCPVCNGSGQVRRKTPPIISQNPLGNWTKCEYCNGTGQLVEE